MRIIKKHPLDGRHPGNERALSDLLALSFDLEGSRLEVVLESVGE